MPLFKHGNKIATNAAFIDDDNFEIHDRQCWAVDQTKDDRMIGQSFRLALLFCAAMVWILSSAATAHAQSASTQAAPEFVVYCYDSSRDMVTRVLTSECTGKVIDEAAAQEIDQRRLHRVSHLLGDHESEPTPATGMRMVSLGTAFYVDPAGILLTNYHVVSGCKAMHLRAIDGSEKQATVIAADIKDDLALLHADSPSEATAHLGTENTLGQISKIFIVGYPDQGLPPLNPLIAAGTLLRGGQNMNGDPMIFHAEVRHGNSGGPIISAEGTVIGIVKAKVNSVGVYNMTGHEADNIGIGIPLPIILGFLQSHDVHYISDEFNSGTIAEAKMTEPPAFVTRAECFR